MFSKMFNRGIASGEGFCNREKEVQQLLMNIDNIIHTLLISSRRFGKTSLALRAIEQSGLPYAHIDLFMKYDRNDILDEFYQALARLVSKVVKPTEKALRMIESLLKNVKISLVIGELGFEFSFARVRENENKNIKSLFVGVDELIAKNKRKAIIFIDEIQTISDSEMRDEIEAALRFVAQKTENVSFIFSGSSRHLLSQIFEDRSRPFYKLCRIMHIQKIQTQHYVPFINKFAVKKWRRSLADDTLEEIFKTTKCHPYYLNILCEKLFEQEVLPDQKAVGEAWRETCKEEQGSVVKDIEPLTSKQKHLLSEIAKQSNLKMPTAQAFVRKSRLTPRGIMQAMQILLRQDIIERLENGEIHFIDPVLEYWLSNPVMV